MIIDILVCSFDGSQRVEQREVPDDWLSVPAAEVPPTQESAVTADKTSAAE